MTTWWLAIDKNYTSYEELKHRKVVAQGWPGLGDLRTLCPLVEARSCEVFKATVRELQRLAYDEVTPADRVMWDLLNLKVHHLVVGIEGTVVRGLCELRQNGWESYQYTSPQAYNYAQTIGFPVDWVDWDPVVFGFTPTAPARGVQGIRELQTKSQQVIESWIAYQRSWGCDNHPYEKLR